MVLAGIQLLLRLHQNNPQILFFLVPASPSRLSRIARAGSTAREAVSLPGKGLFLFCGGRLRSCWNSDDGPRRELNNDRLRCPGNVVTYPPRQNADKGREDPEDNIQVSGGLPEPFLAIKIRLAVHEIDLFVQNSSCDNTIVASCPPQFDVSFARCSRTGRVGVPRLVAQHGADCTIRGSVASLNGDCPRQASVAIMERCDVYFPDLAAKLRA